MKLFLNIGLNIGIEGQTWHLSAVLEQLAHDGFDVINNRLHCRAGAEAVLVVELDAPGGPLTRDAIYALAEKLQQECIAVTHCSGYGALIGPDAPKWGPFDPARFIMLDGSPLRHSVAA